jgi:hypothetical protein
MELSFTDLDALEVAAKSCGLVLRRGQTHHEWYGRWMNDWHGEDSAIAHGRDPRTFGKCDHALRLADHKSGDYEIGLVARADGQGWDAVYDTWGPGRRLEQAAGKRLDKLAQAYGAEVAMRKLKKQGFRVKSLTVDEHGRTHLKVTRGN